MSPAASLAIAEGLADVMRAAHPGWTHKPVQGAVVPTIVSEAKTPCICGEPDCAERDDDGSIRVDEDRACAEIRRRAELFRMPKGDLADMLIRGARTPNGSWRANCGPKRELMKWRKDEIIGDIMAAEFGS